MEIHNFNASNESHQEPRAPYENGNRRDYKDYVGMISFMRKNGLSGGTGYFAPLTWCKNFVDDATIREFLDTDRIDALNGRIAILKERVNENMEAKNKIGEENYEEMDAIVEEIEKISKQLQSGKQ